MTVAGAVAAVALAWWAPSSSAQAGSPPLPAPVVHDLSPRVNDLAPRIEDLAARVLDVRPSVAQTPTGTSLTVSSDVLFAFGRSELSTGAQAILADVVNRLPTASAVVTVTGYTDSIGTDAANLTLSRARAEAVHSYLVAQSSRPGLTYQVVGLGAADPVAANTRPDGSDNPDGRRQNRRVTVSFGAR